MRVPVTDITELQSYMRGVMDRADHHASDVNDIALALVGAIVWKKDGGEPIKVMSQDGETKNVLWVQIGGHRYAFSYNHERGQIEMRRESIRGDVLHGFTNAMPLSALKHVFESL